MRKWEFILRPKCLPFKSFDLLHFRSTITIFFSPITIAQPTTKSADFEPAKASEELYDSRIGSYFAGQYYQVLGQQPDLVHQFYSDASRMIRVDGDSSESASSMLFIDDGIVYQHPASTLQEDKLDSKLNARALLQRHRVQ